MRRAAEELGYVPLEAARQLRVRRSGLLGMTVINIANPFFAELMAGAEDAVAAAGLRVLVGDDRQAPGQSLTTSSSESFAGAVPRSCSKPLA